MLRSTILALVTMLLVASACQSLPGKEQPGVTPASSQKQESATAKQASSSAQQESTTANKASSTAKQESTTAKQETAPTPKSPEEVKNEGTKVKKSYSSPPPMTIDPNKRYVATIETNLGKIVAELLPKEAPKTVNNFVFLAKEGYYDGVKFHRVIKGFMIQTGDPTGTGAGSPGYKFEDEKIVSDYEPGTLAMANSGPNTNGSQFFITHANLKGRLPKSYTIFGRVTDGIDVVDKIASSPVKTSPSGEQSSPSVDLHIDKVTIEEK